jgi:hypothetical protein
VSDSILSGPNLSTRVIVSLGATGRACRISRSRVNAALQAGDELSATTMRHGCAGCGKTGISPSAARASTAAVRTTRTAAESTGDAEGVCAGALPAIPHPTTAMLRKKRDMIPCVHLTDKHKLRRSQINAAARAASAAAFLKSLRRQLHALLGCGPATCFATRRYTVQPARIRKLRRTGQVSKALRRPDRAKVMNHDQSRPRTARAHRPIARTGRSWLVGVTPRDMARARRPARPNGPTKNSANQVHGVLDQPNG